MNGMDTIYYLIRVDQGSWISIHPVFRWPVQRLAENTINAVRFAVSMEVREKKVELIELFYDLIYVYAISNLTLLVEDPEGGVITWQMYSVYIVFSMIIILAWLLMTNYVNRYCTWRWYEYVLVVVNMSAAVLMTQTINNDPELSAVTLIASVAFMIACIIVLYLIQYVKSGRKDSYAKYNLIVLLVMEAVFMAALGLRSAGYEEVAKHIIAVNLVLGMIVPLVARKIYDAAPFSFPHLVERLELLTIIMFGEAIIAITGFIDLTNPEPLGFMNFLVIIMMFGFYVCQVHYLCDHHRVTRAIGMILCHYLILISINLVTVAFIYSDVGEVDTMFVAAMMALSMAVFNISLHGTCIYYHERFQRRPMDTALMLLFTAVGAAVMIGLSGEPYAVSVGAILGFGLNFAYFWMKYRSGTAPATD